VRQTTVQQDTSRIVKTGHSHTLIIPKKVWDALGWRVRDYVSVFADKQKLVIYRIPMEQFRDPSLVLGGEGK
jgi:hypothetical protein